MNELILQVCNTRFVKISEGLFLSNISKIDYTIVLEELRMNSQMRCHHNYYLGIFECVHRPRREKYNSIMDIWAY